MDLTVHAARPAMAAQRPDSASVALDTCIAGGVPIPTGLRHSARSIAKLVRAVFKNPYDNGRYFRIGYLSI